MDGELERRRWTEGTRIEKNSGKRTVDRGHERWMKIVDNRW